MSTIRPGLEQIFTALLCSFSLAFGSLSAVAEVDDFNDGNDNGWFHYDPIGTGSWILANGVYRIQSSPAPSPTTQGPGRAGSVLTNESLSAFYIAVDLVTWDNSLNEVFGLSARSSNPGFRTTQGYGFVYNTRGNGGSGQVGIIRITSELQVTALVASNVALLPNRTYRFIFFGAPGQLNGQVFATTNLSVPLATVSASDGTYPSGSVGLFTYDNSSGSAGRADVTFDNFEFKELPPPLTINKDPTTPDVRLTWPNWASAYRLERTCEFPAEGAAAWENLGLFQPMNDSVVAFDDTSDPSRGQAFYRLAKP